MSRLGWMAVGMVVATAAAALTGCGYPDFVFDGAGGNGSGGGGSSTSKPPSTCDAVDGAEGCCADNVLYYCATSATPVAKPCTDGLVCGWDDFDTYYDCVAPPGGPDPLDEFPITCGH
jgi:hypothetical protein